MALNLTKMAKFKQLNYFFTTEKKAEQRNNTKFSKIRKFRVIFIKLETFCPSPLYLDFYEYKIQNIFQENQ